MKALPKELHPIYFDRKLQMTVQNGCILYSYRVIIPLSYHATIRTKGDSWRPYKYHENEVLGEPPGIFPLYVFCVSPWGY